MPEASAPMALGASAGAPHGFVEFCERQPADCGASQAELAELRATGGGSTQPVAAISYDWTRVFPRTKAKPVQVTTLTYDWTTVFAEARAQHAAQKPAPAKAPATGPFVMSAKAWDLLTRTNDTVNRSIAERSDQQVYGVSEYWATPLEAGLKVGDCEDYALEKRRALVAAGVPASALSLAVVTTPQGQDHAVLLVATDKGEYVLDNLSAWVLPWAKTPYRWRERQVAGQAARWAMPAFAAPAQAQGLLLASLR
jgi:predicted transglutaminase-like cysteine proteinase